MLILALGLLLIIVFVTRQSLFPIALVFFFVLFDMFDGFYKDNQLYAAIRYIIPLTLLLSYLYNKRAFIKSDGIFLILVLYLLLLVIYNPGDVIVSVKTTLAVIIAFLMIPLGRYLGGQGDFLKDFEKYNRTLLILIPAYIIYANIFNIGRSYTFEFTTGFLVASRMYLTPILLFLGIHYIITNKDRGMYIKLLDAGLIILNICILIVITRRTSLGMIVGSLFVYLLLNRKYFFQMLGLVLVLGAALILSYPLYKEKLDAQMANRERIQDIDTYEEEGRYLETLYILEYHEKSGELSELLFGVKLFDTIEFGLKYFGRDRPIHSDINMIFYSTGLVGMLLFSVFLIHYFIIGNSKITPENKKVYYPLLIMFLIILIPGRFIGTFTFAPLLMLLLSAIKYYIPEDDEDEYQLQSEEQLMRTGV
ncbi:hypothetical protein JAO76_08570 [Pontibacter sp. BT310]|uniref:O-antigen ligase domain-containing protein n=1 Tax=Pontibacter populi TaxID=890055 RepID=A0ABS6XAS1_9BACT|nr:MULTISPECIES: hypothetical protein [Pontibacter]MBJ6118242.1 hypothetical protein [Pontibacter sp. BT310]MBR0570669.1 hypothetical protein [Microvirga sp. STS03]MBW3365095.1 hypothetical protein [Pontibacter populi]